jgi:hypothetical protein
MLPLQTNHIIIHPFILYRHACMQQLINKWPQVGQGAQLRAAPESLLDGCVIWGGGDLGGGIVTRTTVDMFAHNKSGIAFRDRSRRSETAVDHKREPNRQPRLLPSCTN